MIKRKPTRRSTNVDVVVKSVSGFQMGAGLTRDEARKLGQDVSELVSRTSKKIKYSAAS